MLQSSLGGRAELRHVQALLLAADKELQAGLLKQTRGAMRPTERQVRVSAGRLPTGYVATMARAVKVATRVSASGGGVRATVRTSARGKTENRDVASINLGRLRHPLFGRRRHWYTTAVKPRFVSDPMDLMTRRVSDGAQQAANDVAETILRG
jgi:hypothetical protein